MGALQSPLARGCAALLFFGVARATAQSPSSIAPANYPLVERILQAENRRDTTDSALSAGARIGDPRVSFIAQRAMARIRDPRFAARDSFPDTPPSVVWPEPAWRVRYRALAALKDTCGALNSALADSGWHVRLRAADLATATCATDSALVATLRTWVRELPRDASRRDAGSVSWHAAAHAIVALGRLRPAESRGALPRLVAHAQWQVRMYAARAAAVVADTATLRSLARDRNDNVKEAAIDALAKLTGHADDVIYLAALNADGAQAVRAAARALKGSPRPDAKAAADAAFEKWVSRANASERDARVALLEAAGRPATDDRAPAPHLNLASSAVSLARGEQLDLVVTLSQASGGGTFRVRLRGDVAPIMAARVLDLVQSRYYDNGNWHRVEPDFVIQGGGPGTNEYVGFSSYLRDELGTIAHPRGTVGMSTRGHDTGDAQWFINLKDNPRLVRDYTVFGEVIAGMDVVDGILEGDVIESVRVVRDP